MATLADIRLRVSSKVGLDNTASGDQPLIDSWANDAARRVLLDSKCYVASATMTLTPGVTDYRLSASILAITDIYITSQGVTGSLLLSNPNELFRLRRSNSGGATTTRVALRGADLLLVYPAPLLADVITVYYVPRPTEMSAGADDPSSATYGGIPVEFHKALEYFVLAEAADYDDDSTSAMGDRYRKLYSEEVSSMRHTLTMKFGRSPRIPIPPRGTRPYYGQPSQIGV